MDLTRIYFPTDRWTTPLLLIVHTRATPSPQIPLPLLPFKARVQFTVMLRHNLAVTARY